MLKDWEAVGRALLDLGGPELLDDVLHHVRLYREARRRNLLKSSDMEKSQEFALQTTHDLGDNQVREDE